jgi:hypothetical protein
MENGTAPHRSPGPDFVKVFKAWPEVFFTVRLKGNNRRWDVCSH